MHKPRSRSVRLRTPVICGTFSSAMRLLTLETTRSGPTIHGSSVTDMASRFLVGWMISAFERSRSEPRPSLYISLMPSFIKIPPDGKSGPGMAAKNFSSCALVGSAAGGAVSSFARTSSSSSVPIFRSCLRDTPSDCSTRPLAAPSLATAFSTSSIAFAISPTLCGSMLVAMPTAIPADPFANKLGSLEGRNSGSSASPS